MYIQTTHLIRMSSTTNNSCEMNADFENTLAVAKAFQQKQKNKALVEEYHAIAANKGKVWSELTTDEMVEIIAENETAKAVAFQAAEESLNCGFTPKVTCTNIACGCDGSKLAEMEKKNDRRSDPDSDWFKEPCLNILQLEKKIEQRPHPTWFNLLGGDARQVMNHIGQLTNGFAALDPQLTQWLMENIGQRAFTTFGYLPAPTDAALTKQIIGRDGYYFKLTTNNTGVDFIWHDRKENHFLFWGPKACVVQAMKIIQSRIRNYNGN